MGGDKQDMIDQIPEQLVMINEPAVQGVIAIHSTARGPAAGGCRLWHYDDIATLTTDAIRLARGMSYKNALADLPLGGGKAVLQLPKGHFDRKAAFEAFANAISRLGGQYITAEDVGTTVNDMKIVRETTPFVAGLTNDGQSDKAGGDPSPWTARGVFASIDAAARMVLGSDLRGQTVAVQGVGNVGTYLCQLLHEAGARLIVADIDERKAQTVSTLFGARMSTIEDILSVEVDILAPCALGGVLNAQSIPQIKARLVCGAANNQLARPEDGEALMARDIVYAPDYVVNAGGIINASAEYLGETTQQVEARINAIAPRLIDILVQSRAGSTPTNRIADAMAGAILRDSSRQMCDNAA